MQHDAWVGIFLNGFLDFGSFAAREPNVGTLAANGATTTDLQLKNRLHSAGDFDSRFAPGTGQGT